MWLFSIGLHYSNDIKYHNRSFSHKNQSLYLSPNRKMFYLSNYITSSNILLSVAFSLCFFIPVKASKQVFESIKPEFWRLLHIHQCSYLLFVDTFHNVLLQTAIFGSSSFPYYFYFCLRQSMSPYVRYISIFEITLDFICTYFYPWGSHDNCTYLYMEDGGGIGIRQVSCFRGKKKELSQKIICTLVFADLRTSNPMHAVKIYRQMSQKKSQYLQKQPKVKY